MPSCHRSHRHPIVSSRIQHYQRMMLLRRLAVQGGRERHEDETNGNDGGGQEGGSSSFRGQRTARRLVMASLMDTHSHRPNLTRQDVHDMLNRALQVTALYSARCVVADETTSSDTRSVTLAEPTAVISDEDRSGDTETSSDTSSCGNKSGGDGDRSSPL
jgi:hypothetical protein